MKARVGVGVPLPISIPLYTIVFTTKTRHLDWSDSGTGPRKDYTTIETNITIVIAKNRAHAEEQAEEILAERYAPEERSRTTYEMGSIGDLVPLSETRES